MAFTIALAGDRCAGGVWHVVPKVAKSGYTPVVGDWVILDASVANAVDLIADNEAPYGEIVVIQGSVLSVLEFLPGTYREVPYTGSPSLGGKVAGVTTSGTHGSTLDRSTIDNDNANGVGTIVAIDGDAPHGTGHLVVRF